MYILVFKICLFHCCIKQLHNISIGYVYDKKSPVTKLIPSQMGVLFGACT